MQQLKDGGRIVSPVGPPDGPQKLEIVSFTIFNQKFVIQTNEKIICFFQIDKVNGKIITKSVSGVRFASLTSQTAQLAG